MAPAGRKLLLGTRCPQSQGWARVEVQSRHVRKMETEIQTGRQHLVYRSKGFPQMRAFLIQQTSVRARHELIEASLTVRVIQQERCVSEQSF